ncbi:Uncharacterised protein [Providencia stuartii]|nr:Uncharacterised protein [Providencia stuartii]
MLYVYLLNFYVVIVLKKREWSEGKNQCMRLYDADHIINSYVFIVVII